MPTTPFPARPLASLPSNAPRGSSHPSFPSKNVRPGFLQSRRLFGGADTPGGRLVRFFSAPPTATDGPPTDVALRPPVILQDNVSGCLSPTTLPISSLWILVRLSAAPVSRSCLPPTILRPVPVDLLDEVKIGLSLCLLVSESCFWVQICQSLQWSVTVQSGQNMNPADSDSFQNELQAQGSVLQRHDQQLTSMAESLQTLVARHESSMESVRDHLRRLPVAAPHPGSSSTSEARVPPPERCSGAPGSCRPFLVQCLPLLRTPTLSLSH